ncbi:hypothetical protein WA577_000017, partial [Blastocystis sp. JDR]
MKWLPAVAFTVDPLHPGGGKGVRHSALLRGDGHDGTRRHHRVPGRVSLHPRAQEAPPGAGLFLSRCGRSSASFSQEYVFSTFQGKPRALQRFRRNLIYSLAAFSIVCYVLQIKDRNDGNILLDKHGVLVHIDFGFMLSNCPGNIHFETAPFKLTPD